MPMKCVCFLTHGKCHCICHGPESRMLDAAATVFMLCLIVALLRGGL